MGMRSKWFLLLFLACGRDTNAPLGTQSAGAGDAEISVNEMGIGPGTVTVAPNARIHFLNTGSAVHQIQADDDCTELNSPELQPGDVFTAKMTHEARRCGYHDRRSSAYGEIIVTAASTSSTGATGDTGPTGATSDTGFTGATDYTGDTGG